MSEVQPEPTPEPEKKPKPQATTDYLILTKEAGFWTEGPTIAARSAKAAIRTYLAEQKATEGTFAAVPARSWQPVTVKTETTTRLTLT